MYAESQLVSFSWSPLRSNVRENRRSCAFSQLPFYLSASQATQPTAVECPCTIPEWQKKGLGVFLLYWPVYLHILFFLIRSKKRKKYLITGTPWKGESMYRTQRTVVVSQGFISQRKQINWGFISCFITFYFRQTESICTTSEEKGFYSKQSRYKIH